MTETLKTDLYDIVSDTNIPWDKLKDSVILITGATGLIGGMLIRALSEANKQRCLNLQIIACGRNREIGDKLTQVTDANFIYHDIRNSSLLTEITGSIDYIIHCAAITKSADMVARPVDVMTTEVNGTQSILRLAQEKGCRSVVYLSSMEVYGQGLSGNIDETNLGYIDLSNPRSCYPVSKRFCEMMCISYTVQHNIPVKIARLAQTFGAGTPQNDTRVFAQFARSSINGENIILHTDGKSRGNYCYTSDTVRGLLTILTKGENSATYNIANTEASVTIQEMAEIVAKEISNGKISVTINIPKDITAHGYAPNVDFVLNTDKLKALSWNPKYGIAKMYKRMITDWLG